jgi:predicted ester cyclase
MRRTVSLVALVALALVLAIWASLVAFEEPARATFPGENGKLAFVSGGSIYTVNPDGSNLEKVPIDVPPGVEISPFRTGGPDWSPDGSRLAFVGYQASAESCFGRRNDIYVVNADVFDEVLAPDFVYHSPGAPADLEGFKQFLPMFRAAFPDMRGTVEDLIAEGDKVVDRITFQATHQGEMMGISPTGNTVTVTEMHISRIAEGKIVERWGQTDMLGMMQQLGAVPPPGQAES